MAQINIYSKEGVLKYTCEKLDYQGVFMGACHVSVSVKSAYPIPFAVGDYISYRGENYTLNYKPDTKKNSSSGTNIDSYTYDNIVFQSVQDETVRCKFRDFVLEDNTIHFTQLSIFTFYDDGSLFQVRDRIQANLDRLYTGDNKWTIEVAPGVTARDGTAVKDHTYSVSNMSVWDILAEMNTQQKVNFVRKGRTITIGAQEMLTDKTKWIFGYGDGNMLTSIETQTSETENVITRMHAYGNSTNMPYRYYNKLWTADDIDANSPISSMNMPRLCLPYFAKLAALSNHPDGSMEYAYYDNGFQITTQANAAYIYTKLWKNANTQITIGGVKVAAAYVSDVWVDSVRGIAKYEIKEDDVYFDTDSIENIYPSMKFMIGSNTVTGQDSTNDNGVAAKDGLIYAPDGSKALTFTVTIPNVGFSVFDEDVKTGETPQLSMTSGMCGSRNFDINHMDAIKDVNNNIIGYTLECKRTLDQSLNLYYPYNDYHIKSGDSFTFVNIFMSNSYVEAASSYMLGKALIYLSLHDTNTITIKPTVDNVLMAEQIADEGYYPVRDIIKEGLKLSIIDDDLSVNTLSGVTISSLTIKEGEGDIPEYEITLSDDKEADLTQRVVSEIKDYMTVAGGGINTSEIAAIVKLEGQNRFVSKLSDDVVNGNINFKKDITVDGQAILNDVVAKNINVGNYIPDSTGATISDGENGTLIEADYLKIRRTAFFRSITITELKQIGGELGLTCAAMVCSNVEEQSDSYRCYFDTTDGTRTVYQEFVVGDQARCQQFKFEQSSNGYVRTKYYWRKVVAIGENFIDLSKTDYDTSVDNSIPTVNDNIIQLGYKGTDPNNYYRRSAIVFSVVAPDSPSQKVYQGINTYSLNGCVVRDDGYSNGEFHTNVYGNSYTGAVDGSNYIKYINGKINIKGSLDIGSTLADGTDINNLNVYKTNLILNSGFTGSYSTEKVSPDSNISDAEMYSDPLLHWETNGNILDNEDSKSGKAISLVNGSLSQIISYPLIVGEKYIFSFKASGTNINISIGGYTESVSLTSISTKYNIKFTCIDNTKGLDITNSTCVFYEPQLILGVIVGDYQVSPDDSRKELSYFENIRYITDAIVNGNTSVLGGLIMSQIIKVGNYRDGSMISETGGMSGAYTTQNDPFIWGGGSLEKAIYTISKYKDNPSYQATDEEISRMSKFVVTHGGRAILTDMVLRGYVYAVGGIFKSITSPNGNFKIDEVGNATLTGGKIGGFDISNNRIGANNDPASSTNGMSLYDSMIIFNDTNRQSVIGVWDALGTPILARFTDTEDAYLTKYGVSIDIRNKAADSVALDMGGGYTQGLCLKTHTSTQSETLNTHVHDVVAIGNSDIVLTLPVMYPWYDGYVITITNLMTANKVSIAPNHGYLYTYDTGSNSYTSTPINNFMVVDRGVKITTTEHYDLSNVSDCSTFVYHNDISNGSNIGAWVQHKHPRDW